METIIRKITMLLNIVLNDNVIYIVNPDGSTLELQPGFDLLDCKRNQMAEFIKGSDDYE
jgi:hypothetical protein